jgi:SAM-dependent methyltransferase
VAAKNSGTGHDSVQCAVKINLIRGREKLFTKFGGIVSKIRFIRFMKKSALRRFASGLKRQVKETMAGLGRRLGLTKKVEWESGLIKDELFFWEKALADGGKNWNPAEFRLRTDLNLPFQDELRKLISAAPNSTVRILDVGSGPLTRVGTQWPGRDVKITATDPLAEHYNALLKKLGIVPPVPVTFAHGEKLLETFPPNHFDLAYASNSLDHSYDPLKAIEQMLAVTKPGGFVYLWHFANGGKHECYSGLHQWNFDVIKGDFIISDGKAARSLAAYFGSGIQLECERTSAFGGEVVIAKIKKMSL